MARRPPWLLFLLLFAFVVAYPADVLAARYSTIVLDPGHGGRDNGAKWGGVPEKRLTLDVAFRVRKILQKKGIRVAMTRSSDRQVSITSRAAIANKYRNAMVVSIHFNAHRNTKITGIETFYASSSGRSIASRIQTRLMRKIRTKNRGIKFTKRLGILNKTRGAAVLVECGFISNPYERTRSNSTWYRQIVAQEIANGIIASR